MLTVIGMSYKIHICIRMSLSIHERIENRKLFIFIVISDLEEVFQPAFIFFSHRHIFILCIPFPLLSLSIYLFKNIIYTLFFLLPVLLRYNFLKDLLFYLFLVASGLSCGMRDLR